MITSFQNPRNPLAAMWASAVETHLREQNPDMNIQQIRQLPMMQGTYGHLSQLKQKLRVAKPPTQAAAKESTQALEIAQMAYLSQTFFDLAVTTASFSSIDSTDIYDYYINLLEDFNSVVNWADFSTKDKMGFALCTIIWVGLVGRPLGLGALEKSLVDYLVGQLQLSSEQKDQINQFWESLEGTNYTLQYRNPSDYSDYGVIPWKIPEGARIVMLGDWGTSLDDAHEFLYAIWKQAYNNSQGGPIVFLHLGDIYYCGLPVECKRNFYDVFVKVGQRLQDDLQDSNFNPNPPIFTIPGNHEYYSLGYGYFELLDALNQNVPNISHADLYQQCSFFCLRTEDNNWQFLGMDTGQADGNGLLAALQAAGDKVKEWLDKKLPSWSWITWITDLAKTTYEEYVGPFQPTLYTQELNWLKDKLDNFGGKTIMLSHHQLFSREAEINHNSPEYKNTWLDNNFRYYYKNQIAAWYWGHEHTFAVYMDGLMGLNKGRLLGSSSYESTEESDTPYANNYPMVPLSANMTDEPEKLIKSNKDGLYNHTGAIMQQNGSEMNVKYYQFPAWSQLDTQPSNLQLEEITQVAETIKTPFKSLEPTWIGAKAIQGDNITTNKNPSITSWNGMLYMLYADGSGTPHLKICTANAADFHPENKNATLEWKDCGKISVNSQSISPSNSPAVIAVNDNLYGFYTEVVENKRYLRIITTAANTDNPVNWAPIGGYTLQVGDAAPAVCFFQGRIYIVYCESDSDNNLCWAYFDIKTNSLHNFGKLNDTNGDNFGSPNTPSLAADAYHIYLAYQHKQESGYESGTDICWAVGVPSSATPTSGSNNIEWQGRGKVESIATGKEKDNETTNPDTNTGLTLQYADGVFLLVYTSTNNNLTQCALNDTDEDNTGTWIGANTVKTGVNTNPSILNSSHAPALAITNGGGFLVYVKKGSNDLYWAYY